MEGCGEEKKSVSKCFMARLKKNTNKTLSVVIVSANTQYSGLSKSYQDGLFLLSSYKMFSNSLTYIYGERIVEISMGVLEDVKD